jgi:hypothetical protein
MFDRQLSRTAFSTARRPARAASGLIQGSMMEDRGSKCAIFLLDPQSSIRSSSSPEKKYKQ